MSASTNYLDNYESEFISGFSQNSEDISSEIYGGKAYWINWLYANGYNIPKSYFVSNKLSVQQDEKMTVEMDRLFDFCVKNYRNNKEEHASNAENKLNLAIRSSSTIEDGFSESKAGNFESFLGEMDREEFKENYLKVLESQALDDEGKMGVIVQELIDPILSGVIFSSNPLNFSKEEVLFSIVEGFGDKLMSGVETGKDIVVKLDCGKISINQFNFNFYNQSSRLKKPEYINKDEIMNKIVELMSIAKEIEAKLGYPVDIEWVIDEEGEIVIIQVRPINNFILKENRIDLVSQENMYKLNKRLIDSDKVKLRLKAEKSDVFISDAYIATLDCSMKKEDLDKSIDFLISKIKRSDRCVGYSAVIVSPQNIDGKIIRAFVGDSNKLDIDLMEKVISYPKYSDLNSCIKSFADIAKESYWTIAIIIQEIYEPEFTGIMNRSEEHFIVEIARGHFASKGILPMSRYIIKDGEILDSVENVQEKILSIREGYVYEENLPCDKRDVRLDISELNKIIEKFSKFYKDGLLVEFGVLSDGSGILKPYLIDTFSMKSDKKITEDCIREIKEGIICPGTIEGKLVKLDYSDKSSIDVHFLDSIKNENETIEKTVFYSRYPDISFLKIIEEFDNENISFIFREGSVLCHFSILLRERNIPSIVGYDIDSLIEGENIILEI